MMSAGGPSSAHGALVGSIGRLAPALEACADGFWPLMAHGALVGSMGCYCECDSRQMESQKLVGFPDLALALWQAFIICLLP